MAMSYTSPGVYVQEVPSASKPIAGVSTSTAAFVSWFADTIQVSATADPVKDPGLTSKLADFAVPTPAKTPVLITNWSGFVAAFGDLVGSSSLPATTSKAAVYDPNQRALAQAVYGFFNNGGGRCYVVRAATSADLAAALATLEPIDEISLVAAPVSIAASDMATFNSTYSALITHCSNAGGRFAILDGPDTATLTGFTAPLSSDLAAYYFPHIKVFDPATKLTNPAGDGLLQVPPSGHLAGIFARVDDARGVYKAPANEPILGALGLTQALSKNDQSGLNPAGVNCLRYLNGNYLVWGARTLAGSGNTDLMYINVRRTLLFLRKSIEQGTSWIVFEPNTPALWQKIILNVEAFLTGVWRDGALFGTTAKEAFYVKCDAELNPQAQRDLGIVVTEIGVAIVRPAEFVVFRISQMAS